jgi:hypothetical protein
MGACLSKRSVSTEKKSFFCFADENGEKNLGKIIVEGTLQVGCPISENFIIISIRQKNDKQ